MELSTIRNDSTVVSSLDGYDGRCRLICAILAAVTQASLTSWAALACTLPFPLFILGKFGLRRYKKYGLAALSVAAITALMIALTWTGGGPRWFFFSPEGTVVGLRVALRIQLITATALPLVAAMGAGGLTSVLERLGAPLKLRVLILLMLRSSLLLAETMGDKMRALALRGPDAPLMLRLNGTACTLGGALIESSDRADRSWQALQCRGGMKGFSRNRGQKMTAADGRLAAFCLIIIVIAWGVELWHF